MIISLVAVLLIGVIAWSAAVAGFHTFLGVFLPLLAVAVFIVGFVWRVACWWGRSPVPFAIPTTGGQQHSLDWIKPNPLDTPFSKPAVVCRMILEIVCFRSLFRNTAAEVSPVGPRATYFSSKWLWAFALIFHYSFFIIFMHHFRFFTDPVPVCISAVEFLDGIMQVGAPRLFMTDVLVVVALLFLFGRRLVNPKVRYISLANDFFPLFLILGLVCTGICMRYFTKVDVAQAKVFIMGLVSLSPQPAGDLGPIFFTHIAFLSVLLMYFPFSKLMHMGGIFLSPTRNMLCNTRQERHVNPWNNVNAPFRTYAEYEDDFREPMAEAGLPLEKQPE